MSDTLIIDTGAALQSKNADTVIQPLPLYDENHPMLKFPIPEYTEALPNANMNELIKRLKMTMKLYGGVGLSANQCGVFQRVFVIGTDQFQMACINPRIIATSTEHSKDNEGCLSYPGLFVKIDRPEWCDVSYYDENGMKKEVRLEGITARCYMHELDHMNGIRFVEHAGPVALQMARRKQEKIIKKIVRHKKK